MKKLNVILLIFSFVLSGIGGIFLFGANASNQSVVQTHAPIVKGITEYTYKTYEDYFIDNFNLPAETYTKDTETGIVTIDYTKITRKTENEGIELLYNGNVFHTITNNDLTGAGSKANPYMVNSTKGFWFLLNVDLFGGNLAGKTFQLNSNIILNDEAFDENGNPSGGDGVVYSWKTRDKNTYTLFIDGKGYYIDGLFINDKTATSASLFRSNYYGTISNINLRGVFINAGDFVAALAETCGHIKNINLISGNIKGTKSAAGIIKTGYKIENCNNYANVWGAFEVGGITSASARTGNITECNNYGNINCDSYGAGGIAGRNQGVIESCNNYGRIYNVANHTGGIVGIFNANDTAKPKILNSTNYGEIIAEKNVIAGGIIGYVEGYFEIRGCQNYGFVSSGEQTCGELVGQIVCANISGDTNIIIENCFVKSVNNRPVVGRVLNSKAETKKIFLTLSKLTIIYNKDSNSSQAILLNCNTKNSIINANDIKVAFESKNAQSVFFIKTILSAEAEINIKNVVVTEEKEGEVSNFDFCSTKNSSSFKIVRIIVNCKTQKFYYGSDFSKYYISWKTGKIGLVALDGRGQFQGAIDEEWLKNNGYEKKSV